MRKATGSRKPIKIPTLDGPQLHGWVIDRVDNDDVIIWCLELDGQDVAKMKPSLTNFDIWHVAVKTGHGPVGWDWFDFNGSLEYITQEVNRIYGENKMDTFEKHGWTQVPGSLEWYLEDSTGSPAAIICSKNKYMWTSCILGTSAQFPKTRPMHKITKEVKDIIQAIETRGPGRNPEDDYSLEGRL